MLRPKPLFQISCWAVVRLDEKQAALKLGFEGNEGLYDIEP